MTLVNRLTAFALSGLAVVLIGFSTTLFALAWVHLHRQADDRAATAVHALVAAVEIHPTDVEWEPTERRITLGEEDGLEHVRWSVHDAAGRVVDFSDNLTRANAEEADGPWSIFAYSVRAGEYSPEPLEIGQPNTLREAIAGLGLEAFDGLSPPRNPLHQSTAFTLTVAVSRRPVITALWQAGGILSGVSLAIWGIAAMTCRYVCRRALSPVTVMAASGRSLGGDPAARLEVPATGDELEDLGQAFNDLLGRLEAAYDRQRRFTGDAAHQLRTPLTALIGHVEVALRQDRSAADYQKVLEIVSRRGSHLRQIVESLLFLARAEADRRFDLDVLELRVWLLDRASEWADHPRADDLTFEGTEGEACWATVHAGLLGQALDNLLDNALKYSLPGTPVRVRLVATPANVRLSVEDKGCGIASEDLPHLGEPFFRPEATRLRGIPGVGLGLTVARRAAAVQGGELTVESKSGQGCRVTVTLPAISKVTSAKQLVFEVFTQLGGSDDATQKSVPIGVHTD